MFGCESELPLEAVLTSQRADKEWMWVRSHDIHVPLASESNSVCSGRL